ncbi:hypothetical protein Poli38472_010369 [Pythium oligandrum]|uniref:Cilia- and flagella-associated protein 61 N-terminal domain-containing protein n=1 Tax=Pythium oligandrum TaxID=41045 RepID=A0A8K1FDE3_PYTOL|nr:hypothetical protein Poli38472_010369 [Pythium oligandrum]|eukprot:TMW55487.1 hypothetical protein Poli38472_010369 [Pythium oligandrum]
MSAYAIRRAVDADQADVTDLDVPDAATRKRYFGRGLLGAVIETSVLALTATDSERPERVLGFAAFDDKPPTQELSERNEAFRTYLFNRFELPRASTWLYLSSFAQKHTGNGHARGGAMLKHLLHAAFSTLQSKRRVLLVLPLSVEIENEATGFHKFFERVPQRETSITTGAAAFLGDLDTFESYAVYQAQSRDFHAALHVRRARVEDHDDLEPILRKQSESLSRQFGDYFLAELIKDQDEHNVCLVAQSGANEGRAVGLLALSDEIEVSTLQASFELEPYNNLGTNDLASGHTSALRPPQIIIAGPPASGKGTQCELLVDEFGVVHLSTGDMLRTAIQAHSPLGLQAQTFMDKGELVPDELIIDVILERLQEADCRTHGWLLDGFPRTAKQAHALTQCGILPDLLIVLDVPDDEVVKRISGRRVDPDTGKTYHLEFNPPPAQDEALRGRLIQRSDDTEATVRTRLGKYHENCDAVVDAFRGEDTKTTVLTVVGTQPKQVIADEAFETLHSIKNAQKFQYLVQKKHIAPPRMIITGPPAGGKGTQCELLVDQFNVVHLSTGDMLRASIQAGAPLGMQAKGYMDKGELVPDELIIDLILARLQEPDCQSRGWLLDGFPRTATQASVMLAQGIVPDVVLVLDVPDEEVIQRISGRRVDLTTGKTYHLTFNPPPPEVRDRVIQRSDDNEETIRNRLDKFHENCDTVLSTFATYDAANVQIVRCDGLLSKTVISQSFTQPIYQRMLDAEATLAVAVASEGLGSADQATGNPWKRVEDEQARNNCFAITLFSLDDRLDSVGALDLLVHAFAAFPDKAFCLLTLPTNAPEPSFLGLFTLVPPQATSTFSHVLYVLHRDAIAFFHPTSSDGNDVLTPLELTVTRYVGGTQDAAVQPLLQGVEPFVKASVQQGLALAGEELDIELEENPKHVTFLVYANHTSAVGLVTLVRDHEVTSRLRHHFELESLLLMTHHRTKDQAIVKQFVLNPVLYAASRYVLQEITRLFRKTCLFYPVDITPKGKGKGSPVVHEFVLAPPRRSIAISADEVAQYPEDVNKIEQTARFDEFALFVLSKKVLSEPKLVVNQRLVIVGASDAALTCLQRLLSVPYLRFTNITLISPQGLAFAEALTPEPLVKPSPDAVDPLDFARKSLYTRTEIDQFSLRTHIRVVESRVVQLDRVARAVVLQDGSCLPYDYLAMTTGLQDGTFTALGRFPSFDGESYASPKVPERVVALGDVKTARWLHKRLEIESEEAANQRIAVYGSSFFALQVIHGLLARGVDGSRIVHLSPARDSVFEDTQIRSEVDKELTKRGVIVQYNTKVTSLVVHEGTQTLEGVQTMPTVSVHTPGDVITGPGHHHPHHPAPTPASTATLVPCGWLLCCQHNDADYDVFRAINESGLVYDGRLVVNGLMRTTDPSILAAGSLCRFSRRFIHAKLHEHYNAKECGELLAASLLQLLDPFASALTHDDHQGARKTLSTSASAPSLGGTGSPTANGQVVPPPEMRLPVIRTTVVPGGKTYVQISIPSLINTLSLQVLPTRASQSVSPRYTSLLFDDFGVLNRLEYLGDERVEVNNLQCVVGLHESYLNSAIASFANAYVDDWIAFFHQKWASALYHDRFHEFCLRLNSLLKKDDGIRQLVEDISKFFAETGDVKSTTAMAQVRVGRGGDALVPSTKRLIESQLLEFLSANRDVLAMYLLPRASSSSQKKR